MFHIAKRGETIMPLPSYGVLIGTLNHFVREDPNNFGSWYHGKLYIDTPMGCTNALWTYPLPVA